MIEHWERTVIKGWTPDDKQRSEQREEILHQRGVDPFVLACKRNRELAGHTHFDIYTEEAFVQTRQDEDGRRRKADIPKDGRNGEEWDW